MTQVKVSLKVGYIYLVMLLVGEVGSADLTDLLSSLNIKREVYRVICITK